MYVSSRFGYTLELHTVPSTLKNADGVSLPNVVVETVNTPSGKVKPA